MFVSENDRYAISVPLSQQMAIIDVATRAEGYGFPGVVIDGMDLVKSYQATRQGIKHARSQGPILLEMKVERLMPHTTDDDDRRYRGEGEVEQARLRDPLVTFPAYLKELGILTDQAAGEIGAEAQRLVNEATDAAEAASPPDASEMLSHVYAP